MPKLNTTIDNIELKTNKVIGELPSNTWTDAQYPSAKTLYNTYTGLRSMSHPIGSVLIMTTNVDPTNTVGGTWELMDKGFKSYSDFVDNGIIFTPAVGITPTAIYMARGEKTIRIRISLAANTTLTDAGLDLGMLNFDKIGISNLHSSFINQVTYQDDIATGGIVYSVLADSGLVKQTDVFGVTSIGANANFSLDFTFVVHHDHMLDGACDKFYWKRTA